MYVISFHKIHIVIQYTAGVRCNNDRDEDKFLATLLDLFSRSDHDEAHPPARETAQGDTYCTRQRVVLCILHP